MLTRQRVAYTVQETEAAFHLKLERRLSQVPSTRDPSNVFIHGTTISRILRQLNQSTSEATQLPLRVVEWIPSHSSTVATLGSLVHRRVHFKALGWDCRQAYIQVDPKYFDSPTVGTGKPT